MKQELLEAVKAKHEAKALEARVNINVYERSVGIGEHPDLVGAVEDQVKTYAESMEIIDAVTELLNHEQESF
jgi:hypothetical protein